MPTDEDHPTSDARRPSLISVAMATFDGAPFLRQQLDSIVRQTRLPDELIIRDDGSTDETLAICTRFAEQAPFPVDVGVNAANLGSTRNFEEALAACSGDYVFLCDQDDVWHDTKIETMAAYLDARPNLCLAIHDLRYCDADLNPTPHTKLARVRALGGDSDRYVTGMATVVRRSLLEVALPVPDPAVHAHDDWLHECAIALHGKGVNEVVLAEYRRHATNATGNSLINAVERGSRRERFRRSLAATSLQQLRQERARHAAVHAWLEDRQRLIVKRGLATASTVSNGRKTYATRVRSIDARIERLQLSRLRRLLPVTVAYLTGDYRSFRGIRSALKDVVQRTV